MEVVAVDSGSSGYLFSRELEREAALGNVSREITWAADVRGHGVYSGAVRNVKGAIALGSPSSSR